MLFCGDVYGQWGAGDWPTTDKYFRGRQRLLQVRSGIVERATAANVSTNGIKPAGFFVQRSALTNYKHFIQASLVPEYVHSGTTNAVGNFYSSNDLQAVTFWTASNILVDVGAPTNYFDSTPYFNLSSVSNGWMFMRDIVDRLKWTTTEDYVYVYSQKWGDTFCAITTNVCADALVILTNDYGTSVWMDVVAGGFVTTNYSINSDSRIRGGDYEGVLQRRKIKFVASNLTETIWHSLDVVAYRPYTFASIFNEVVSCDWGADADNDDLDGLGVGLFTFTTDHTGAAQSNAVVVSDWLGSGAETSPFTLGGQPTCSPWGVSAGTELNQPQFIVRWDVTNGFKYVAD